MGIQTNTVERPRRTRGKPTDDGDFVVYEHVPLFDEHEGDDGVPYDERLLRCIADNNNRRIRTTGDWCPIVLAHTRDQEDKQHVNDDPPVLGLAGPFYVSDFTNGRGEVVKCIYATFWIFAEDDRVFRKNPRRSVEIWPEDKPENRYFDPISVLGAETPKRDLGLIYSRQSGGHQSTTHAIGGPFRYSKRSVAKAIKYQESAPSTTPGQNNTFLPGFAKPKKKPPQQNAKGPTMALSPDDLNQIVEALKPTIQSMIDSSNVGGSGDDLPIDDDGLGMPPPGGDLGASAGGGLPPPPPAAGAGAPPGMPGMPPPPPGGADGSPEMPVDDDIPSPDGMDDDSKLYSRGLGKKFMKYFKGGDLDGKGADGFMGSLDDDDKKHLGSYMKYMCDDDGAKQKYSERYAKSPFGGTDMTEKPGDSTPSGSMNPAEMKNGEPERYARGGSQQYAKLKKDRDEAIQKYGKLHAEHESLKVKYAKADDELRKSRVKERYAKRHSEMTELATTHALNVEEELAETDDFNDAQFESHKERIKSKYQKVSGGFVVPNGGERQLPTGPADDRSQRYAKACGDAVMKYRKDGKSVNYNTVMQHMIDNDGKIDESKLFATNGNGKAH